MYLVFLKKLAFKDNNHSKLKISKRKYLKLNNNNEYTFKQDGELSFFKTHNDAVKVIDKLKLSNCHVELMDNLLYAVI